MARLLKPSGCLAVQMPDNLAEPSHSLMRAVAADGPWSAHLLDAEAARTPIAPVGDYYDWLQAEGCSVDIWTTTYVHPLPDAAAIVDWLTATGLRPYLAPLPESLPPGFLSAYLSTLKTAYPPRANGRVLLSFPRLFIVARRDA